MINYSITTSINIFLFLNFVRSEWNMTELFELYKSKYNRVYINERVEQIAFYNFMDNLNKMKAAELRANTTGTPTIYKPNIYADQDTEEVSEHYGLNIKPYDNIINGTQIHKRSDKPLEFMHLYDLDKVDDLYKDWMKKWGKVNSTKKFEREVHYYRFIKSVVENNKRKLEGLDATLDQDADIVKEPEEFFY